MSGKHKKVLVVDDDELVCMILAKLVSDTGAEVVCANDGEEAATLLNEHQFDLAFIDLIMPNKSGWELIDKIESHAQLDGTNIPVVAITGAELSGEETEKLSSRTCAIVNKGDFNLDKMKNMLGELLS